MEVNATELAELIGKDPSTIRAWTRRGMPCIQKPRKGTEGRFSVAVAVHWHLGDHWARKSRVTLTAPQKLAVGYALGDKADRQLFADLVEESGLEADPGELLGFAQGLLAGNGVPR
jgi:hypothetical protein